MVHKICRSFIFIGIPQLQRSSSRWRFLLFAWWPLPWLAWLPQLPCQVRLPPWTRRDECLSSQRSLFLTRSKRDQVSLTDLKTYGPKTFERFLLDFFPYLVAGVSALRCWYVDTDMDESDCYDLCDGDYDYDFGDCYCCWILHFMVLEISVRKRMTWVTTCMLVKQKASYQICFRLIFCNLSVVGPIDIWEI